jgi:hypothetical protein
LGLNHTDNAKSRKPKTVDKKRIESSQKDRKNLKRVDSFDENDFEESDSDELSEEEEQQEKRQDNGNLID